ncbi:MAG: amidohydrolase family protein [Desulfobulbaceae bacterium]|nr:amidohydrolase family protein [Desulfobulbaceae bacterium]
MLLVHRAPVVLPISAPPISDGAILTDAGFIVEVGSYAQLRGRGQVRDHEGAILLPALINCHAHLELSHLAVLGQRQPLQGDMTGWIGELLAARQHSADDGSSAGRLALDALHEQGVALVADIGNLPGSAKIGEGHPVAVHFFLEMLGFSQHSAANALARMQESQGDCTSHAPYSNHARLLVAAKQRANSRNRIFPIHVAESRAEIDLLLDGSGPLRSFIEERGFWDGSFVPPGCGAVTYLDRLGIIDDKTLCVHCVHVTDEEIALLAARQARVCLCPGSNRQLGVGRAPVEKMVRSGLVLGLGTDSLASNPQLSIWEEMRLLREDHPQLAPATVLAMATRGGAQCLAAGDSGELAPGRRADIIAAHAQGITAGKADDFLTNAGKNLRVRWVEEA